MADTNFRKNVEEYHDTPFYRRLGRLQNKY